MFVHSEVRQHLFKNTRTTARTLSFLVDIAQVQTRPLKTPFDFF